MAAPQYKKAVEFLINQINEGKLPPGSQLPTHRALADQLKLAPATISRAYDDLRKMGLIVGEVGRGTFVRNASCHSLDDLNGQGIAADNIDLSLNYPILEDQDALLGATFMEITQEKEVWASLLSYQPPAGRLSDREAACIWFKSRGAITSPEQVLVTAGAQHGIAVALMACCRPGDKIAVDALTYPGFKILAGLQNIDLVAIEMDSDGLRPESLERACRRHMLRALYCMPSVHNPLGTVWPAQRRQDIAEICRKHDLFVLEDDAYGFLHDDPKLPSMLSLLPERCFNIQSMAKVFAPGLRIGYLAAPDILYEETRTAIRSTTWTASPITAELASRWLRDAHAERLVAQKRADATHRQGIAAQYLPPEAISAHPASYHVWLRLPPRVRNDAFIRRLQSQHVIVSPLSAFSASKNHAASAVRIALGSVSEATLRRGLQIVAQAYEAFR